ncbi:MAG: hypothetical protein E6Q24_19585 [Chitinophagaceae bacterium]|nr:MAG: hypothetical protein E6Q24_19585 [Chitinophagaceae bacterium]
MKHFFTLSTALCIVIAVNAQYFINDNVVAGISGTHWQGFKSNGPTTTWGFQQNDVMYVGIGGNLYNKGFSTNAMGIFNGSLTKEDVFLFNQNSGNADFLVLKNSGNVGIGTTTPFAKLHVKSGAVAVSDLNYDHINARLMVADQVPLVRFTRWTGSGQVQQNAFVGQFYNNSAAEYSLGLGTGSSSTGDQSETDTRLTIKLNGNIGIGTTNPQEKLVVAGNMQARKVKVSIDAGADFVFEQGYNLRKLEEVKQYIQQHKHLPEIPSAKDMESGGVELGSMNIMLLQKIEELTLYLIQQKQEIDELRKKLQTVTGDE